MSASRSVLTTMLILLVAAVVPVSSPAKDGDAANSIEARGNFRVRGFLFYSAVVGESEAKGSIHGVVSCEVLTPFGPVPVTGDISSSGTAATQSTIGGAASVEYVLFDGRVGLEAGGLFVNDLIEYELSSKMTNTNPPTAVPDVAQSGAVDAYMLALAVNFHLRPHSNIDVYLGPIIAPSVNMAGTEAIDVGKSVVFGGTLGADYFTNNSLFFSAKLSYIDFGQVIIEEGWGITGKGKIGTLARCGGKVYSGFEAKDDLRFLAVMIGGGITF